jgi:hypothetical protein
VASIGSLAVGVYFYRYLGATYLVVNGLLLLNSILYFISATRNEALFLFEGIKKILAPNPDYLMDRFIAQFDFWLLVYAILTESMLAIRYMIYTSSHYADMFVCGEPCREYDLFHHRTITDENYVDDIKVQEYYKSFIAFDIGMYLSLFLMAISVCDVSFLYIVCCNSSDYFV